MTDTSVSDVGMGGEVVGDAIVMGVDVDTDGAGPGVDVARMLVVQCGWRGYRLCWCRLSLIHI